jgi:hypothetical protein
VTAGDTGASGELAAESPRADSPVG